MKTSKYKIKIICGFRRDQEHTIDANEAHKAYYLFNNPDKRGTFDNGLALRGSDIRGIVPDYNATMGWNADHVLDGNDYNQIHAEGVMAKLQSILSTAKEVARVGNQSELRMPLIDLYKGRYAALRSGSEQSQKLLENKNQS